MESKKAILIFGVGPLQQSLIERCKLKGLYTVGIDPNPNAVNKHLVNVFEVVEGNDFERTLSIAKKFNISGVITAATDKPLVMMANIAKELCLPFFQLETAINSTDKMLMKKKFMEAHIQCAHGFLVNDTTKFFDFNVSFPIIVKPRDNSGSRGVIYCENIECFYKAVKESLGYTKKGNVIIEEYIEGKEYSVEGIHYNGQNHVIQITEKTTTDFPYNVELCHIQPADIKEDQQIEIKKLINKIAQTLGFDNCASHTEIKINSKGIFVIETSPRLGGDFISSKLVPLSTGINMEDVLIDISINNIFDQKCLSSVKCKYSGIKYFNLPIGVVYQIDNLDELMSIQGVIDLHFELKIGDKVNNITNSAERYGYVIIQVENSEELLRIMSLIEQTSNLCINKN